MQSLSERGLGRVLRTVFQGWASGMGGRHPPPPAPEMGAVLLAGEQTAGCLRSHVHTHTDTHARAH